jgi:hypothetical protein
MKQLLIAVPFIAAIGCTSSATDTRPPISELKPGLNMIDTGDPTWGVSAAYVKDGHVVYLEERLGALKPQVYRDSAPNEPANEIDMRFVDETGKTFFVQRGGDEYVDATWSDDINLSFKNPAPDAQRVNDFVLAREAAAAFAHDATPDLQAYSFHAAQFAAKPAPSQDPEMIKKAANIEASRPTETGYASWGGGGSWWLEGDLYSKNTGCAFWVCVAKHSGVAMFAYQTGWQLVINSCNHGSCPGYSDMSYNCYSTSGVWRSNPSLSGEASGSTGTISGGCLTSYSWNSGDYNHLCNDDSAYELWQIKNGNSGGWSYDTNGNGYDFVYNGPGTGGDGGWVNYACTCAYNNGCNNDWSRPYCP